MGTVQFSLLGKLFATLSTDELYFFFFWVWKKRHRLGLQYTSVGVPFRGTNRFYKALK